MAETAKPATVGKSPYEEVVVHPLVLLSVVDHFRRVEEVRVPRANGATPPHRAARRRRASIACHARTLHPDVHQIQLTSPLLLRRIQDDSEDKRVVGVLLGEHRKGRLGVTSSFAGTLPFRIDDAKPRACHNPALSPRRASPRACLAVSPDLRRSFFAVPL